MAFHRAFTLILLLCCSVWLANAANYVLHSSLKDYFLGEIQANITTNISLWAPYFRNVSSGEAWMISSGALGLGPRAMKCQCFNPDETCCIAKSNDIAPFCVPQNSTCCSDTFCDPGETCCGDSCCPSNTVCTFNNVATGCCPKDQLCSGPAICYDHASPNCTNTYFPLPQCCPPSVPFCRDFSPIGTGCFATSAEPIVTTTMGKPFSAFSESSDPVQSARGPIVTITETITLEEIEQNSTSVIQVPTNSVSATELIATASVQNTNISTSTSTSTSLAPNTTTKAPTSTSTTPSTTTKPPPSTLCFNPDLQSPAPCPSSSSSKNPPPPPAASTYNPSTSLSPKLLSSIPACVGVSLTFTISLLISSFGCYRRRGRPGSSSSPGVNTKTGTKAQAKEEAKRPEPLSRQRTPSIVPGELLEGRTPQG